MQLQITKSPLFVAPQIQFKVKRREIDPEVSTEDRARRHHGCCEAGHDADADQVLAGEEQTRDVCLRPQPRREPGVGEPSHAVLHPVSLPKLRPEVEVVGQRRRELGVVNVVPHAGKEERSLHSLTPTSFQSC